MPKSADIALKTYRAKRRFDKTREPSGAASSAPGARYVVQKHDARRLHYDFRLELDGVLLSWAVTRGPSTNTKDKRLAVRTEDHPLEYGNFEGIIPPGSYGAGTVVLWDSGTWEPQGDPRQSLKKGKLAFVLNGERLHGHWALVRMRPDEKARKAKRENWLLIKERDEFANSTTDILETTTSVESGRDLEDIAEAPTAHHGQSRLPAFQPPMLATLVDNPPAAPGWIFEVKYDGYRALLAADGDAVRVYTRSGLDWTGKFPQIARATAALHLDRALIDGEIVVIDHHGRTDFGALVHALETGKGVLSCMVFDLLEHAGRDLRGDTLQERKAALKKLLGKQNKNAIIQYSEDFFGGDDTGLKLAKVVCAHGLEGIIAKRADAPYRGGRHGDWLKIKCGHAQEFVIIGFSPSSRLAFASILLAVRDDATLRYAGRVGSGFSGATLRQLAALRDENEVKKPPCGGVPHDMAQGVIWVKPVMVVQIEFAGWTRDRMIRHGRFIALREDKIAGEIRQQAPKRAAAAMIGGVQITHGDRTISADHDVSKTDIAAYLQRAAALMMPHITDRFVSFLRCPGGIEKCFFQRHLSTGFGDSWQTKKITTKNGEPKTYTYCEKPEALIHAVQMGVLEFHIWGSKIGTLDKPDRIVFDLDPDDSVAFETVKQAAFRLRDVLAALDLQSLPMLSGGKGIHVVAPIRPRREWPEIKQFAGDLAARVAADAPEQYLATMSKAKRKGKIFIDHFRNEIAATAIAPYSPRARPGAPVAWPLTWTTLKSSSAANEVSITAAHAALEAGDNGWAEFKNIAQPLSAAALRAITK